MWFKVNVRLSEVTDLKWPHGTEGQCGNSTLAMSWPNHVQILSFASMASRQGAVKHGFVSKIAGGCFSYDVIAPWPDLTWSIFFYQKLRKVCPIRYPKTRRCVAPPFFRYLRKTSGGGLHQPPLVPARVKAAYHDWWPGWLPMAVVSAVFLTFRFFSQYWVHDYYRQTRWTYIWC